MTTIRTILLWEKGTETELLTDLNSIGDAFNYLLHCFLRGDKCHGYIGWENGSALVIDIEKGKAPEIEIYNGDITTKTTTLEDLKVILDMLRLSPQIEVIEKQAKNEIS